MRGYLFSRSSERTGAGSIPTHAGSPSSSPHSWRLWRVYPRAYGATSGGVSLTRRRWGLSPCIRSYHHHQVLRAHVKGFPPVYTGLPSGPRRSRASRRVYPRAYGVTRQRRHVVYVSQGLSPCARGYPAGVASLRDASGSIPVYTGLPSRTRSLLHVSGVYPRAYGATCQNRPLCHTQ
jgi:hypothetical protein